MPATTKSRRGTNRVILFSVAGLIIGLNSHLYEKDTFLITKVVLGLPYKISAAVYQFMIGTNAEDAQNTMALLNTDFFPNSLIATNLAKWVTPMLLAIFIFGSFAYFTGDKEIFTLQRYVRFFYGNMLVLILLVCLVYGVNKKADSDNCALKGIQTFILQSNQMISEEFRGKEAAELRTSLQQDLREDSDITRDTEQEIQIGLILGRGTRFADAYVNVQEQYIAVEDGTVYHVGKKFCQYVKEYRQKGTIREFRNSQEAI